MSRLILLDITLFYLMKGVRSRLRKLSMLRSYRSRNIDMPMNRSDFWVIFRVFLRLKIMRKFNVFVGSLSQEDVFIMFNGIFKEKVGGNNIDSTQFFIVTNLLKKHIASVNNDFEF